MQRNRQANLDLECRFDPADSDVWIRISEFQTQMIISLPNPVSGSTGRYGLPSSVASIWVLRTMITQL